MKYEELDPILEPWAKAHGLTICTKYRDEEVRSARIVDDAGNIFGIGVWPDKSNILISIADHQSKTQSYQAETAIDELPAMLEKVYAQIEKWIAASGNTRTPVT